MAALDDGSKVAVVLDKNDLAVLIAALESSPDEGQYAKRQELLKGLCELRDVAFV